jgi:metal-dependent hydrolase (beta-lactamase superfamily II)
MAAVESRINFFERKLPKAISPCHATVFAVKSALRYEAVPGFHPIKSGRSAIIPDSY